MSAILILSPIHAESKLCTAQGAHSVTANDAVSSQTFSDLEMGEAWCNPAFPTWNSKDGQMERSTKLHQHKISKAYI